MYIGVDLVKIKRWEKIIEKYPERLKKIFTTEEIEHCEKKAERKPNRMPPFGVQEKPQAKHWE